MEAFLRLVWGSVRLAGAVVAMLLLAVDVSQRGGLVLVPTGVAVAVAGLLPAAVAPRAGGAAAVSILGTLGVSLSGADPFSFGLAEAGGLGVLLVQGTRSLPGERAAWLCPLTALAVLALPARLNGTASVPFTLLLAVCVIVAAGVGLSLRFQDELRARAAAQERTDDRLALARELHDTVAHAVTGMVVRAQAAQLAVPAGPGRDPDVVGDALADIEREGSRALTEMRRVVGLLRTDGVPPPAATVPVERLRAQVDSFSGGTLRAGVHVEPSLAQAELPIETGVALQRIVAEALTNVRRHAPGARRADVALRMSGDALCVSVVDDGPPAPPAQGGGFGLVGLAERVSLLGGSFSAGPGPAGGWRVVATLPLPPVPP